MGKQNLNIEENALTLEETEQAVTTAGKALDEMIAADGVIGEAMLEEEMSPEGELTDEEAEFASKGGIQLRTPSPLYPLKRKQS